MRSSVEPGLPNTVVIPNPRRRRKTASRTVGFESVRACSPIRSTFTRSCIARSPPGKPSSSAHALRIGVYVEAAASRKADEREARLLRQADRETRRRRDGSKQRDADGGRFLRHL